MAVAIANAIPSVRADEGQRDRDGNRSGLAVAVELAAMSGEPITYSTPLEARSTFRSTSTENLSP